MATSTHSLHLFGNSGNVAAQGDIGSTVSTTLADNLNQFSVSFWIKTTQIDEDAGIMAKGTTNPPDWLIYMNDTNPNAGGIQFQIAYAGGAGTFNLQSKTIVNDGVWHNVVCVYDNTLNPGGYIYIDGTLSLVNYDFSNHALTNSFSNTSPFYLGGPVNSQPFDQLVDDLRIYGRALSASEALTLAEGGDPSSTSLLAYWKMDEGSGTTLADSSGNGNTITFSSGPTGWSTDVPGPLSGGKKKSSMFQVF